jgi:uncharacterized protein YbaA (DUF1428 family)
MKNKLFLALALAGAVACKKDNTPTPSPNTNDVNAQVTEFINKLDLSKDLATQVEAFAKTLKNDTEMEKILVGLSREAEPKTWTLVSFDEPVNVSNNETVNFSWIEKPIKLSSSYTDKAMNYDDYKNQHGNQIVFEDAMDFEVKTGQDPSSTWISSTFIVYTNNSFIKIETYKTCTIQKFDISINAINGGVNNIAGGFFYNAYGEISNDPVAVNLEQLFDARDKKQQEKYEGKQICWDRITSSTFVVSDLQSNGFTLRSHSFIDKNILTQNKTTIDYFSSFNTLMTNVSYK